MIENKSIIIKATDHCNLFCRYCYLDDRLKLKKETSIISTRVLDTFFKKVDEETRGVIDLIWHGGEPLLPGPAFYKDIFSREEKLKNVKVKNYIQTNGVLLNEKILDMFLQNQMCIGISFDGPKEIHDMLRITPNNGGSYKSVSKAMNMLNRKRVQFGVITTLTSYHVGNEKKLFEEYKKYSCSAKLNPFHPTGRGEKEREELEVSPNEIASFLKNMYDIWVGDKSRKEMLISPYDDLIRIIIGIKPKECVFYDCKDDFLEMEPTGNFYPCGKFAGIEAYCLGNIFDDSITKMIKRKKQLFSDKRKSRKYKCVFSSYIESGNLDGHSTLTKSYDDVIHHIKDDLIDRKIIT